MLNQACWYYFFEESGDHLTIPLYPLKYPTNFAQSNSVTQKKIQREMLF